MMTCRYAGPRLNIHVHSAGSLYVRLHHITGISESQLDEASLKLFETYDTDRNQLVDSLEFLSSMALLSGMEVEEKIKCNGRIKRREGRGLLSIYVSVFTTRLVYPFVIRRCCVHT